MKQALLTILRDRSISTELYRQTTHRLGQILAVESTAFLSQKQPSIELEEPVLIPILRSGIALLPPFVEMYPRAPIGMIGIRRDEKTALPHFYYSNLPPISTRAPVFLLDPMVATGGSAVMAVNLLKEAGVEEKRIVFIAILASQEGKQRLQKHFPSLHLQIVQVDPTLNAQKMIVPGLGDFGDRYFTSASN